MKLYSSGLYTYFYIQMLSNVGIVLWLDYSSVPIEIVLKYLLDCYNLVWVTNQCLPIYVQPFACRP